VNLERVMHIYCKVVFCKYTLTVKWTRLFAKNSRKDRHLYTGNIRQTWIRKHYL